MDTLLQLSQERQSKLDSAKNEFFKAGGKVESFGQSVTKHREINSWRPTEQSKIDARKKASIRDSELRRLITDNAAVITEFGHIRRTPMQLKKKLIKLGEPLTIQQVEQLAARFGVPLADCGKRI